MLFTLSLSFAKQYYLGENKMKIFKVVSFLVALLLVVGCPQKNEAKQPTVESDVKQAAIIKEHRQQTKEPLVNKKLTYRGTVKYFNLEGGFFGIITDKGQKFLPQGLSREMLTDGAKIEFSGQMIKGMMTIQQWGTPFKVTDAKLISPGKPVKPGYGNDLLE